jgi:hypothetical protein
MEQYTEDDTFVILCRIPYSDITKRLGSLGRSIYHNEELKRYNSYLEKKRLIPNRWWLGNCKGRCKRCINIYMNYTILLLPIILVGCSLIPSKFDSSLQDHLTTLSVTVDQAVPACGTADEPAFVSKINGESKFVSKYTTYTSTDLAQPIALMDKAVTEMANMYAAGTPSVGYCKLKLEIINADLKLILKASGDKDK